MPFKVVEADQAMAKGTVAHSAFNPNAFIMAAMAESFCRLFCKDISVLHSSRPTYEAGRNMANENMEHNDYPLKIVCQVNA
jgi:hypothetical protein